MPPSTVIPAVQSILSGVQGIKRAYDRAPGSLNKADLPAAIVVPQEATLQPLTANGYRESRAYLIMLYVLPLSIDSFGAGLNQARDLIEPVHQAFAAAFRLNNLPGVLYAAIEGDSGTVTMVYGQSEYAGVEFRLQVHEIYQAAVDA